MIRETVFLRKTRLGLGFYRKFPDISGTQLTEEVAVIKSWFARIQWVFPESLWVMMMDVRIVNVEMAEPSLAYQGHVRAVRALAIIEVMFSSYYDLSLGEY
jgi:hypothetical protein